MLNLRLLTLLIILNSVAFPSCIMQNNISGKWISETPEKSATGNFGIRQFIIDKENWEVQSTIYLDSSLNLPIFTFRGLGKYSIGKASASVENAKEAIFHFDKKYMTLRTNDTSLIRKFGLDKCNLIYEQETDITESGCAYLASKDVCAQEYDLVSRSGNILFLGARPLSGGMCEEAKRPKALGRPLKKVND
jgi:hypothetical protein